jgi:FMN-dependent NADH-azoreductase
LAFKDEKSCIHKRHAGSASEELADAVLRIFSLVGFLGITDFDRIIYEKYQMNKVRVYRHEGKVV